MGERETKLTFRSPDQLVYNEAKARSLRTSAKWKRTVSRILDTRPGDIKYHSRGVQTVDPMVDEMHNNFSVIHEESSSSDRRSGDATNSAHNEASVSRGGAALVASRGTVASKHSELYFYRYLTAKRYGELKDCTYLRIRPPKEGEGNNTAPNSKTEIGRAMSVTSSSSSVEHRRAARAALNKSRVLNRLRNFRSGSRFEHVQVVTATDTPIGRSREGSQVSLSEQSFETVKSTQFKKQLRVGDKDSGSVLIHLLPPLKQSKPGALRKQQNKNLSSALNN